MFSLVFFSFFILVTVATEKPIYGDHTLSIGAFNVQVFGQSKLKKSGVLPALVKTFRRWDIGLIQEIRDSSDTAVWDLLKAINDWNGPKYALVLSDRTGRSNSKEQYGFFYRTDVVSVKKSYNYADPQDVFEREPFPVLFQISQSKQKFFIVPLHSKPEDAGPEIDRLLDVYADAKKKFRLTAAVLMGDFNADCSYLSKKKKTALKLANHKDWNWLIDDDANTTTSKSSCAYDRIIVTDNLHKIVKTGSARVFKFDAAYKLDAKTTKVVSDHYPVEFALRNCGRKSKRTIEANKACTIIEPALDENGRVMKVDADADDNGENLSVGAIIGISFGCVFAVALVVGVVGFLYFQAKGDGVEYAQAI